MTRRRAFTIIELLVVIGIICILIALFLPMASRAKDQARNVQCASNMRQIFQATLAYAGDNQEALFYAPAYGLPHSTAPYPYLMHFTGSTADPGVIDYTQGVLWAYIVPTNLSNGSTTGAIAGVVSARQNILTCPSDIGEPPNSFPNVVRNFSYSFNAGLNYQIKQFNYPGTIPPVGSAANLEKYVLSFSPDMNPGDPAYTPSVRLTSIVSPSHKILIFEETAPNDGWCNADDPLGNDYLSQRHNLHGKTTSSFNNANNINSVNKVVGGAGGGMGNQCFADGHVELFEPFAVWNQARYCDLHGSP